jgi:type IV pilus assembly protein PilO
MPFDIKNLDFKKIDLKNNPMQRMLVIMLASLLIFVLYIYFVFVPQIGRVTALVGKVGKMRTELKPAKSTIAEMGGLKKRLNDYNEKIELYEKRLPAEQEIPSLLENLSSMAKSANIKITSIMPAPKAAEESAQKQNAIYKEIPILITAKSGYHELGKFLSDLENSNRIMKVVDISIKEDKDSHTQHNIELKVCTYVLLHEKR